MAIVKRIGRLAIKRRVRTLQVIDLQMGSGVPACRADGFVGVLGK